MTQTNSPDKLKESYIQDILYLLERMTLKEIARVRWYAGQL